jgi:hypothetical protein
VVRGTASGEVPEKRALSKLALGRPDTEEYRKGDFAGYLSEKSLALIGNASGQDAEGAGNCPEAFSIRRLEGRHWQWWALLWSCGRDSAPVNEGKSLEERGGRSCYARLGCVEGVISRSERREEPSIRG